MGPEGQRGSISCASFSFAELGDWVASFFWGLIKGPQCSQAFSLWEDWKQDVKFLGCSGTASPAPILEMIRIPRSLPALRNWSTPRFKIKGQEDGQWGCGMEEGRQHSKPRKEAWQLGYEQQQSFTRTF